MTDPKQTNIKVVPLQNIDESLIGQTVSTFGMVDKIRNSGKAGVFIDLYQSFSFLKCISSSEIVNEALEEYSKKEKKCEIKTEKVIDNKQEPLSQSLSGLKVTNLSPHSTVSVTIQVKPNISKKDQHLTKIECHIIKMSIYSLSPPFPLNTESSSFTQLQLAHLNLQTPSRRLFLFCRSLLLQKFRQFYYQNKYYEITPPTLVTTQVEGGSTLFDLNYYGNKAYLTQSSQLYLETVIASCGKSFCIMPSYRAEKFNTTRHLSEYTHVEAEMANIRFSELVDEIELLVKNVVGSFLNDLEKEKIYCTTGNEMLKNHLEKVKKIVEEDFLRVTYKDAIEILKKNDVYKDKEKETKYSYGDDISDRDEVKLIEILGNKPVFLVGFPVEHKPFYCRRSVIDDEEDKLASTNSYDHSKTELNGFSGEVTESVDLLWPGIGEILGGSMRIEDHAQLMEGFEREGIDSKPYYWYTDIRLFGASRHGGYGLGFERLLKAVMNYENVNVACLYPRFPGRCEP